MLQENDVFIVNLTRFDQFRTLNLGIFVSQDDAKASFVHARSHTISKILRKTGLSDPTQIPMSTWGKGINKKSTLTDRGGTPIASISLTKKKIIMPKSVTETDANQKFVENAPVSQNLKCKLPF